jgi:CRISPR-associated protein Cas2
MSSTTPLLLCYDIKDPKRLQRVHKCAKKVGMPLQYSVFYLEMNNADVTQLLNQLSRLIDVTQDDIKIYAISRFDDIEFLGASLLADGIQLFTQGKPLLR